MSFCARFVVVVIASSRLVPFRMTGASVIEVPITVSHHENVGSLKEQVLRVGGIPATLAPVYALTWGHVKLQGNRSLVANDIQDKDTISLHASSSG